MLKIEPPAKWHTNMFVLAISAEFPLQGNRQRSALRLDKDLKITLTSLIYDLTNKARTKDKSQGPIGTALYGNNQKKQNGGNNKNKGVKGNNKDKDTCSYYKTFSIKHDRLGCLKNPKNKVEREEQEEKNIKKQLRYDKFKKSQYSGAKKNSKDKKSDKKKNNNNSSVFSLRIGTLILNVLLNALLSI